MERVSAVDDQRASRPKRAKRGLSADEGDPVVRSVVQSSSSRGQDAQENRCVECKAGCGTRALADTLLRMPPAVL